MRRYGIHSESQDERALVPSGPNVLNDISRDCMDFVITGLSFRIEKKLTIVL